MPVKLIQYVVTGDVALKDLEVKQSALDELNLPVRPVFGHIGCLTLKIPWSNLYQAQWVAVVERVMVVVVPNTSIKYDPKGEEKLLHETKMAALQRAEDAKIKLQEIEKGTKTKSQDSFQEKLIAQVIRNIQVTIQDIHIRYEDSVSCPNSPFAVGVTLHDLSMKSTDSSWKPCLDTDKLIYKIDSKPEDDDPSFSIPVFNLDFVMDELAIGLSRHQYSNIMALLDSFDRLKISSKYRKWLYAYNCKLENIRRVHHNWSWKHIKEHRGMCHRYKAAYKAKLENKRLTTAQVQDIKESEYSLDVFNLTLVRRQAEMEVEREGELQRQEKQKRGWFSGWFFGSAEKESEDTAKDEDNLVKKLKAEINDEEKQKLFEAIGYSESGPPPDFPPEFVNLRLHFLLKQLVLTVTDEDAHEAIVTRVKLEQVASVVQNRSGADALRVEASVREFVVEGYCVDGSPPRLVTSQNIAVDSPLLDVTFETNPLDGLCDQRVQVSSEPVHVVYDAATINQLADVFAPPKNVSLQQLQAAALSQLEVVKERSVTGLQSAIDNHSVLDLNIAFAASHIIIPERGSYSRGCSALVVTLGSMKMKSVPRPKAVPAVADLVSLGHSQEEVMETVRSYSYDHFTIELIDIQAIVSLCDEDWKSTLCCHEATPLHLLQPTTLRVDFYKCLLTNDPNLPKVKINVTLNDVALSVVDQRLLQLAYIAHSIPLVQKKEEEEPVSTFDQDIDVNMNVITEDVALARLERAELNPCGEQQETPQFTQLALAFTVNEISIELKKASGTQSQPLMKVAALSASVELTQRTFDLNMSVILGGVLVDHLEGGERRLLSTPLAEGSSEALLVMKFTQVDPKSPDFQSKHNSTSQLLRVDVSNMKAQLEQSAILSILAFVEQLDYKLSQLTPTPAEPAREATTTPQQPPENLPAEPSDKIKTKALVRQKKHTSDVITLKIVAKLGQVSVIIGLRSREVAQVDVAGLIVNVLMRGKDITITSQLKDFTVIDPARAALHPKIVEVVGTEAWDAKVSLYGEATDGAQYLNMQCVDTSITLTFGCARIVFLNKFIADVLGWVDKFQSAKEALASASVAAAAAAQATLQEAYKECSRISLSLTLRAPLILVPQDSKSLSGLMIDLGQISINNKVELSVTGSLEREYELLQPISLTILICRNLTISWHKQRPEIDIQAKVAPIKVCLSEEDLLVTLTVLQDNLGEESIAISTEDVPTAEITEATESEKDIERVLAQHGHIFTKIKFSFTMEVVTLALLTGGSDAQNAPSMPSDTSNVSGLLQVSDTASGELPHSSHTNVNAASSFPRVTLGETSKSQFSPSHVFSLSSAEGSEVHRVSSGSKIMNPREALAEVSLQLVRIKGDMMSDGSLAANLVLFDCILQDTRPGQEGFITRMMERRKRSGERGMIDLTYHQEPTKDIFVDLRISGFVLVLHLPYLLRIQRFFMDNMPQRPEAPSPQPAKPKDIAKTKTDTKNDDGQPSSIMTLRVKVEQPDIALVDNVSTTDTSCIILHAEVNSDIKQTPMHQHINASITNIQMYTCCYNPEKRHKTLSQILNPCELSLMCSVTPSHAEHVDLKLSQVDLRVSPGTIELLSSILTVLSTLETPSEDMKEDVQEAFEAFAVDVTEAVSPVSGSLGGEMALVAMECLLVTLEAGSLTSPIPLIKLQASISATATGFRSQRVNLNGQLSTELAYYNPRLAVWEPLLEPVEMRGKYGAPEHTPWTLQFEVTKELSGGTSQASSTVSPVASPDADEVEEFEEYPLPDPLCTVSVTAKDSLELTVTRTSIEVFTSVSEAFSEAYNRSVTGAKAPRAPYRIVNRTGMHISVSVMQSGFRVASDGGEKVEQVTVESGAQVDLFEMKPLTPKHKRVMSLVAECQTIQDRNILLKIPSLECSCSIPVARADKRFFEVNHMKGGEKWGLVAGITVENGCKTITLSSCVQVTNHLDVTVDVYYMTERGNEVEFVLSLEQDECAMLPLLAVYTPTAELFFSVKGHSVCIVPFVWRVLQNNPGHVQELQCVPRDVHEVHAIPFLIAATGDVEQILWENTSRRTMKSALYKVHLRPPMVLHNLLPVPISLDPPGTIVSCVIMPGSSLHLTKARLGSMYLELKLLDYQSRDWVCGKSLEMNPPELSVWTFESRGDIMGGPLHLDLGMLVAKSGASFSLSLYCPFWMVNKTGLMLTYRRWASVVSLASTTSSIGRLAFFGKKKATVKVMDGDWSEKFSLDVVGSSGSVTCKAPNRNYQLGVDIKLGSSGLTKIVIFSPFYKILNNAPIDLEVIEYGGILGEVSITEGGIVIKLDQIFQGAATALIINQLTNTTISFWQDEHESNKMSLSPQSTQLYTWNEPGGSLKMFWACGSGKAVSHMLDQDDQGKMENDSIHWVVFLSNNQRCLLFTDDISIASSALNAVELERCDQDINLSLSSIGLSLVDDIKKKEVMYLSLASSGVVWEYRKVKGKKHRPFTHAQTESIEKSHQVYQNQIKAIADASFIQSSFELGKALEVDFSTMTCSKPFKRKIRRTFQPGVWFQPFCEVSIYQRLTSPLFAQYKYLAVLIQEFHVKVELPFVFAIMEIVSPVNEMSPDLYSVEKYENDVGIIHETLTTTVKSQSAGGQRDFFDHLHLSPIKMHLSFSLSGTESGAGVPVGGQVIHLFLQSVGVTLTEVQDVVFRLAYMERLNQWMNWNQLVQEMIVHYRGQVIKQLYVLVLGLDVIGNPFGLVVGLTKGVEDLFYEPIQGAIEGPGEFAEGMLLGVASFMGKTVGGAAGAVSRITGTIGKGVAALTLDDEYQKRRREAMHRKPADGIESLARGGKGIVTGVVDGVTGVFMKPIDGAKEEGFEGFFKGVGKGMVGLELEKGRYAKTDLYVAHAHLTASKSILIATNKRIMQVTRNDILGSLKVDWVHCYEELSETPVLTPKGLRLSVKQEKKRMLGVFGGGDNSKIVHINSNEQAEVSPNVGRQYVHGVEHSSTLLGRAQSPASPPHSPAAHTSRKKGLFGVLGAIGTGVTQAGKDIGRGFSHLGNLGSGSSGRGSSLSTNSRVGDSSRGRHPQHHSLQSPRHNLSQQNKQMVVFAELFVVVPYEEPQMQWFLSAMTKAYLKMGQ
ncbi:Vacuolar protein sorting-associated protein 13C-like [Homarus americanus]|uniref:Vacuolar protein sorting-associated protein 13C-like n=1 Tax=Homarus americanus TaxID=6706 RepID=A0A8J5N8S3_HOMAM|nr:Vacuolar protein sorting-associated protein 13C-like [Homarus americanus]